MKTVSVEKCNEQDTVLVGQFYDEVMLWLNNNVNYPRWIYKVYPSENSVRTVVDAGCQYIYREGIDLRCFRIEKKELL